MDLKAAVAVAIRHIGESFAADAPQNLRLEGFLYDDHLMVWSLTIGFTPSDLEEPFNSVPRARSHKVVRVSEADKSVLSIRDR
jgi:hypothetical protein